MHHWLSVVAFFVCGLAHSSERPSRLDKCKDNEPCTIDGVLAIDSLWQARLDFDNECAALALPREVFDKRSKFDGKKATVVGEVAPQPQDEKGSFFYSYEIEGARVNINLCNKVIVVKSIATFDGESWGRASDRPGS